MPRKTEWKRVQSTDLGTGGISLKPLADAGTASFIATACESLGVSFSQAMRVLDAGGELVAGGVACRLVK